MSSQVSEARDFISETAPFARELRTKRIVMRPLRVEDSAQMAALITPRIAQMTGTFCVPYLSLAGEFFILRQPSLERRSLCQNWVMEVEGAFAGVIGCFRPSAQSDWEIGYWLGEPFWGAGLASEAVEAVLAEFRRVFPQGELWARVFTDNPASRRVLEKSGWRVTGTESGHCMERQESVEGWRLRSPFTAAQTLDAKRADPMDAMMDEALRLRPKVRADAA
jgi:RimJ/RimL family protein N-acetyltransferase